MLAKSAASRARRRARIFALSFLFLFYITCVDLASTVRVSGDDCDGDGTMGVSSHVQKKSQRRPDKMQSALDAAQRWSHSVVGSSRSLAAGSGGPGDATHSGGIYSCPMIEALLGSARARSPLNCRILLHSLE